MPHKVLVTCPPMLNRLQHYSDYAAKRDIELVPAKTTQVLSEAELKALLPDYVGWIIGDDPATRDVFETARRGQLRACIKWGVGTDNVDFQACRDLGIPVSNTPGVFGNEVADLAISFITGLARQSYLIDRSIRTGAEWPKPAGRSLHETSGLVVGYGDIGRQTATRMAACGMTLSVVDPAYQPTAATDYPDIDWERGDLSQFDYLVFTAPLNPSTHHMFNHDTLARIKEGVYVVNVGRGPVIMEEALFEGLRAGRIAAAALDVFEVEPLPQNSDLRQFPQCIFGSHNGSNTIEAVDRVSQLAIDKICGYLSDI